MSSNTGNGKASEPEIDEQSPEEENVKKIEVVVKDRRRFTTDGETDDAPEVAEEMQEVVTEQEETEGPDTIINEEVAPEVVSEEDRLRGKLKEMEEKMLEADRQVKDFADRFHHAQKQLKVETEALRARMQRTFDQRLETARGDIIGGMLETLDNLKRAVAAAENSESGESDFAALLDGVKATASIFESRMQGLGLKAIESIGKEFNPELHEAVEIVVVDDDQDNRVIEEYQTGYMFGERLLRPAKVRVGRAE